MNALTMAEVKARNRAAGGHFFDRKTMRFFASRIHGGLRRGVFFVTSEKTGFTSTARRFTIRMVTPDFDIRTVGQYRGYVFLEDARAAINALEVR